MAFPVRYKTKGFWFSVAVGVVVGGAMPLIADRLRDLSTLSVDDTLALATGLLYALMGLFLAVAHVIMPTAQAMTTHRTAQVLFFIVSAAVLLVPTFAAPALSPAATYGIFLVALTVLTALTWIIWRGADEMLQRALELSSVWTLAVFQVILLAYGAAHTLGLDARIGPWGLAALLLMVNMFVSRVAGRKAGLGELAADEA